MAEEEEEIFEEGDLMAEEMVEGVAVESKEKSRRNLQRSARNPCRSIERHMR